VSAVRNLVRALIVLAIVALAGALAFLYVRASAEKAATPTVAQRQEQTDERLLRQLIRADMAAPEVAAVPTYSDFARVLRDGVAKVLDSQESLRVRLTSGTDLLDRYPPDGVPGRHLRAYLRQNSDWKVATIRSLNEQIRAIKDLRGDLEAFYLSHPDEYDRMGKKTEETIATSLELRRPAAGILQRYAAARAALAVKPSAPARAEYSYAASAYESWKRSL
jgi:type II secretory pathway pseudopilin PulG